MSTATKTPISYIWHASKYKVQARFQGFIERGLESEVTFAQDIPYEQVHKYY